MQRALPIFIFGLCGMPFLLAAQEEIFHGGPGSGAARAASGTVTPPPTYAPLYSGGPGSGGANAASAPLAPPAVYADLYRGGSADGAGSNASGSLLPATTYAELYSGGPADGAASNASGPLLPAATYAELYSGGPADGAASNASGPLLPATTYAELYSGGPADGAASGTSGPLFPPQIGQELYSGGPADGFAIGASAALVPPLVFQELYAGGPADGFASGASAALELPPTYAQAFSGGPADGFAFLASGAVEPPPTYSQAYGGGVADGAAGTTGRPPVPNDLRLVSVLSPDTITPFPAGDQPIVLVLENTGVDTITSAEIRWRVNNVAQPPYPWTGLLPPEARDTVSIGQYAFQTGIPHDILAWSFQPNGIPDPLWFNDTARAEGLYAALHGVYTLGGGGSDFLSFQSAATALNKGGVLGPVQLRVRDGVYKEQFTLQEIRGASAINRVTFESESGDSTAATLAGVPTAQANYLVRLDGAAWVTFKNLCFRTPNQAYATVVLFQNSAAHIALQNNWIVSEGRQGPLVEGRGRYLDMRFNRLENGAQGIVCQAFNSEAGALFVTHNLFLNQSQTGLSLRYADSAAVTGNHFTSEVAASNYQAILALNCGPATAVTKNSIAANAGSGIQLLNSGGTPAGRIRVANNMVAISGGNDAGYGIRLNANYVDIWHNSVRMGTAHPQSMAFYQEGGDHNAVQNNVFAHAGTGTVAAANSLQGCNFNNYFAGSNATLANWQGAPKSTLAAWQSATGQDANTLTVDPLFNAATDLHSAQAQLNGAGTLLPEVPDDIDGDLREALAPDPGADELNTTPNDAGVAALLAPASGCALGAAETVRVRIQNFGSTPLSGFSAAYRLGADPPVTQPYGGAPIPPGAAVEMTFNTPVNLGAPGNYALQAYTTFGSDSRHSNDTVATALTHAPVPAAPTGLLPADHSTGLPVNPALSWQPAAFATAYALSLWPATAPEPATPTVDNLTQINYLVSPALDNGTDYRWRIAAKNAWCATPSAVQQFTTFHLPDLVPENLAATSTVFNGQSIAVQWTTRNQGLGATAANWGEAVYLSNDDIFGGDVFLGSIANIGALNPGQFHTNTLNVTLPADLFGSYYLIIFLDRWSNLSEASKDNNIAILPVQINLTPPPDLEVSSVAPPPVGLFPSGQPLPVSFSVLNTGDGPTVQGSWTDRFFYSTNPVFNFNSAVPFTEKNHTGNLAVNAGYTDNVSWNIPNGLSGTYYIYAITDANKVEFEHAFEGNNISRSNPFTVLVPGTPDLKVARVVPPAAAANKTTAVVQWTLKNTGLATAAAGWKDKVYLSANAALTNVSSAIFLGERVHPAALAPGDSAVVQASFTMPDGITGPFYAYVFTDADDQIFEYAAANTNNLTRSAAAFQVLTPDLTVQSLVAPDTARAGDEILIYWTLKNQSPTAVLSNGAWTDKVTMTPSPTPLLGVVWELAQVPGTATLLPNGILLRQATVQVPNGILGQRYLYLQTDYYNTVYEQSGENNNGNPAGVPIYVKPSSYPDLHPTAVVPGSGATAGGVLNFSFTVENAGTGIGQGAAWQDRVYLQSTPTFNAGQATLLSTFQEIRAIASAGTYTTTGSAVLPATLPAGTYYLFVHTDAANTLFENYIEANNILGSAGFVVQAYPPVDLLAKGVLYPDTVRAGENFSLPYTVENRAAVATPQSSWTDGVYLSADSLFSPGSDVLVVRQTRGQPLGGNSTYTEALSLAIPPGTPGGRYWLFVVADDQSRNPDSNPANNAGVRRNTAQAAAPLIVESAVPPDLVVYSLVAPSPLSSGQPFPVVFAVANKGAGPTVSGAWTDAFFLSDDFQLNAGDLYLGAVVHSGDLVPGATYADTLSLTIPVQLSGNRVLLAVTDYNKVEYEQLFENNNVATTSLLVQQPLPADLVAENAVGPATAVVGRAAIFSWKTLNRGLNIAQGYRRDALYLSTDTLWQPDDPLLGVLDLSSTLPPQNDENHTLSALLNGVAVDTYYVLVRTDILNNLYESSETNNTAVSAQRIVVTVPLLPFDVAVPDTLASMASLYYRIEVPPALAGKTMLVTLQTALPAVNELYLRLAQAPTRVTYDFKFATPFAGNQDIIVPSLQAGTYYLLAYGSAASGQPQPVTLRAEIVAFQVISVQADKGGNTGSMTLKVRGANFSPGMTLRLANAADTITAHAVYFSDATQVFATFNLAGAATGIYDLIAEKNTGEKDVLPGAFEVTTGSVTGTNGGGNTGGFFCNIQNVGADALTALSVQHPASTRPNRIVTMQINYGNNGNVDIPAPTRFLVSLGGAPLAFEAEDLPANAQELLLKFDESGGPPGVLRPGVTGTLKVVTKAIAPLIFKIQ